MHKEVLYYSRGSKLFHWIVALLVILMLSFGFFMEDMAKNLQPIVYMVHKSVGLTILALMIMRLFWILYKGKPKLPPTVPYWERALATIVQWSLYAFLFLMPISGWIMSVAADRTPVYFGLFKVKLWGIPVNKALANFMDNSHTVIACILIGLVILHVLGAIKHAAIDKDKVFERML